MPCCSGWTVWTYNHALAADPFVVHLPIPDLRQTAGGAVVRRGALRIGGGRSSGRRPAGGSGARHAGGGRAAAPRHGNGRPVRKPLPRSGRCSAGRGSRRNSDCGSRRGPGPHRRCPLPARRCTAAATGRRLAGDGRIPAARPPAARDGADCQRADRSGPADDQDRRHAGRVVRAPGPGRRGVAGTVRRAERRRVATFPRGGGDASRRRRCGATRSRTFSAAASQGRRVRRRTGAGRRRTRNRSSGVSREPHAGRGAAAAPGRGARAGRPAGARG